MKIQHFVSVVAPVRDESPIIEAFVRETVSILDETFENYELLLVDDGSQDETVSKIQGMLDHYQGIRLIRLSRQFGEEVAISAGLESVIGDYVVVMMPSMDPPALIPSLVEHSLAGIDVVFGVHAGPRTEGWLYRTGSKLFFWYCERFLEIKLPKNSTQLRCLSRKALNAITQSKDSYRYLRLSSYYVGYPPEVRLHARLPGPTPATEGPGRGGQDRRRLHHRELAAPAPCGHLDRHPGRLAEHRLYCDRCSCLCLERF